jgi:hypothetical protein
VLDEGEAVGCKLVAASYDAQAAPSAAARTMKSGEARNSFE